MPWDGSYKLITKDCNNCEFYRNINNKKICGWGVTFKYLVSNKKSKKCEVKNRKQNSKHSIEYLDELIEK